MYLITAILSWTRSVLIHISHDEEDGDTMKIF